MERCLRSLHRLPEITDLTITVVDNGSSDNTVPMIERCFPDVTLIRNQENAGFARAHNQAFGLGSSPFHLVLNSDTEVDAGAIEYCRNYLTDHPATGAVGCRIANPDGSTQNSVFRFPSLRGVVSTTLWLAQAFPDNPTLNHDRYGRTEFTRPTDVEVVMGSFLMVRRADIEGDLFDDGFFMYAEEADLCARLRNRDLAVTFLPVVSVSHVKGASSRTARQRAWSDEAKKRSVLRFLRKWAGPEVAYLANTIMLVGMVPRSVVWLASDLINRVRGRPAGQLWKAHAAGFHATAMARPSIMDERFHGPPPSPG